MREIELDIEEGADMIDGKPALPILTLSAWRVTGSIAPGRLQR
jgi:delta-aminolevulinic acid dehydratase/porphobilinogen synthase